jgi:hypothetical protein
MKASVNLPPFRIVAAALRTTTEMLAREVVDPQTTPPDWNEFEWAVARAVTAMHGLGALLANRLRWHGPKQWTTFLDEQRDHGHAHYVHAGRVLARLDDAARRGGIACVALKGSALRALQLHQPGERPMGDIDLLVAPRDVSECNAIFAQIGYEPAFAVRRHAVFVPAGAGAPHAFAEHADNPLKIELHTHIAECLPVTPVDITRYIWPMPLRPGINEYASRVALFRHVLLHAAGNMRAHALRFIQLYDIARFAQRLQPDDWRQLLGGANAQPDSWWIYAPLSLAARYVPGNIPSEVLTSFRAICPPWLRARARTHDLYEVSWSNLRISALPGAEWARTPLELMRFMKSRVAPSRIARQELFLTARAQSSLSQVRWYGASHGERILRWVFSRPPRVQTLVSVRAALADSRLRC